MANQSAAQGLVPVSHINGGNWNGKTSRYYIAQSDTNTYGIGDVVVSQAGAGDGQVNGVSVNGVPQVTKAGLLSNPRGVIVSFESIPSDAGQRVIPATKTRGYFVNVADDPLLICHVQMDNVNTLSPTVVGQYADLNVQAPAGLLGVSGTMLASTSVSTNGGLPFRILGLYKGDFTANAQMLVSFNMHELG